MQIEEGKFYKNRVGDKVGPMRFVGLYPWADNCHRLYTNKGMYGVLESSSKDLIEEWEEPATEADGGWGDWVPGQAPAGSAFEDGKDVQQEFIGGVWRQRSRPRKPVVKKLERVIGTPTKSYRVLFNEIDGVIDCSSVKMEPL
jgi:hypothetical protein